MKFMAQTGSSVSLTSFFSSLAQVGYVKYDFKQPEAIPEDILGTFDMVIIDPPFITKDVWDLYAVATQKLLKVSSSTDDREPHLDH